MKSQLQKLGAVICLLTGLSFTARAQTRVDLTNFALMRGDYDNNSRVYLGSDKNTVTRTLGNPTATSSQYSDMYDQTVDIWTYSGNKLYFLDNKLVHAVVINNVLAIGASYSTAFRVGDRATVKVERIPFPMHPGQFITQTTKSFYNYSLDKSPGTSTGIPYSMSSLSYLRDSSGDVDELIEVLFDSGDRIINIDLGS